MTPRIPEQAPDWLLRLLTPLLAKHIAGQLAKDNPGLEPGQIAEKMRTDLGEAPDPRALLLIDAVERYLPPPAAQSAEPGLRWPSGLVLLALKMALDLRAHLKEHRTPAGAP